MVRVWSIATAAIPPSWLSSSGVFPFWIFVLPHIAHSEAAFIYWDQLGCYLMGWGSSFTITAFTRISASSFLLFTSLCVIGWIVFMFHIFLAAYACINIAHFFIDILMLVFFEYLSLFLYLSRPSFPHLGPSALLSVGSTEFQLLLVCFAQ